MQERAPTPVTDRPSAVLLTGFGPFPGVARNATGLIVPRIAAAARRRHPRLVVRSAILPTEWLAAPRRLAKLYAMHRPTVALHFGVSREATAFTIETTARNACRSAPDAAGLHPPAAWLDALGPATRPTRLPVAAIEARLRLLGLPVARSDDAGGYLCNAVLYHALSHSEATDGSACAGFIHVPADAGDAGSAVPLKAAMAGGLAILEACLDAVLTRA